MGCQYCLIQLVGIALYALPRILWFMFRRVVEAYILSLIALVRGLPEIADLIAEYCIKKIIEIGVPVQNYEPQLRWFAQVIGYIIILLCWVFTAFCTVWIVKLIVLGYVVHR